MGNKKRLAKEYRKFQVETVKRMYDKSIFINCFGEIDLAMYAEITGLSEKKVLKLLKKFFNARCNAFYKECKKKYENPHALLIRLFYSFLPLRFIAKKVHIDTLAIRNTISNYTEDEYRMVWDDLVEKPNRTDREERFVREFIVLKKLHLIALIKDQYTTMINEGYTEEEALNKSHVDKETMDKYLSMTQEETEAFAEKEIYDFLDKK